MQPMAKGIVCQVNIKSSTFPKYTPLWLDKDCSAIVVTENTITQIQY